MSALAIIAGLVAAVYGLRWPAVVVRRTPDPIRRAARAARIDDFRNRRVVEHASQDER